MKCSYNYTYNYFFSKNAIITLNIFLIYDSVIYFVLDKKGKRPRSVISPDNDMWVNPNVPTEWLSLYLYQNFDFVT